MPTNAIGELAPRKPIPLPKFQLFILLSIQFAEPMTGQRLAPYYIISWTKTHKTPALVIYPFVVQLVRDTGITGGDEAKTGYYAGLLVRGVCLSHSIN